MWRSGKSPGSGKRLLCGLLLLVALSVGCYSQDPAEMSTAQILTELKNIINEQETRLTELGTLLAERESILISLQKTLNSLRSELSASVESLKQARMAIDEQGNYSKSLQNELRIQKAISWVLGIVAIGGVAGWIITGLF